MIRIDTAADLDDLLGGFNVAVYSVDKTGPGLLGAGATVAEAVEDARRTLREWRTPKEAPKLIAAMLGPERCNFLDIGADEIAEDILEVCRDGTADALHDRILDERSGTECTREDVDLYCQLLRSAVGVQW